MVRNSPVEPVAAYDDGKDSERRAQRQMKTKFSQFDSAEPHPVFSKDSERRAQRQMKTKFSQVDSAEPHPVFFKDSERRAQRQKKNRVFRNLTLPSRILSSPKIRKGEGRDCPAPKMGQPNSAHPRAGLRPVGAFPFLREKMPAAKRPPAGAKFDAEPPERTVLS